MVTREIGLDDVIQALEELPGSEGIRSVVRLDGA
jgi:hypothetical protein